MFHPLPVFWLFFCLFVSHLMVSFRKAFCYLLCECIPGQLLSQPLAEGSICLLKCHQKGKWREAQENPSTEPFTEPSASSSTASGHSRTTLRSDQRRNCQPTLQMRKEVHRDCVAYPGLRASKQWSQISKIGLWLHMGIPSTTGNLLPVVAYQRQGQFVTVALG